MTRPDFPIVASLIVPTQNFNKPEVDCALEQSNLCLNGQNQSDCRVIVGENSASEVRGYACWGRVPLTKGRHYLDWTVRDPDIRSQSFGQALREYLQKKVLEKEEGSLSSRLQEKLRIPEPRNSAEGLAMRRDLATRLLRCRG